MKDHRRRAYQEYVSSVYLSAVYQYQSVTRVRVNGDGTTGKRHVPYINHARDKSSDLRDALESLFDLTDAPTATELRERLHRDWSGFVKKVGLTLAVDDTAKLERLLEDFRAVRDVLEMLTQADLPELSGDVAEAVAALEAQAALQV